MNPLLLSIIPNAPGLGKTQCISKCHFDIRNYLQQNIRSTNTTVAKQGSCGYIEVHDCQ